MSDLGFVHRFHPGEDGRLTLLLLHGTGGDENDLVPVGRALAPGAALLSPRGQVLENGMPRFFRRLAEGVFDEDDLVRRTHDLVGFVERAVAAYGLDPSDVVAVGFSNGANIAASLLLLHPGLLRAAVLLRPMVPLEPDPLPDLAGTRVLVAGGRLDPIVPRESTERLAALLEAAGSQVELHWAEAGHGLTQDDLRRASSWIAHLSWDGEAAR